MRLMFFVSIFFVSYFLKSIPKFMRLMFFVSIFFVSYFLKSYFQKIYFQKMRLLMIMYTLITWSSQVHNFHVAVRLTKTHLPAWSIFCTYFFYFIFLENNVSQILRNVKCNISGGIQGVPQKCTLFLYYLYLQLKLRYFKSVYFIL